MGKFVKRYSKIYSDNGGASKYPILEKAIKIISILMTVFLSTIMLKLFVNKCSGYIAYVLDLIFYILFPLGLVLFFCLDIISIVVGIIDGKSFKEAITVKLTLILFTVMCAALYFFAPRTTDLIQDIPYCLNSNPVKLSGVLLDVRKLRQEGFFSINGTTFKTGVLKYRHLMTEGKTAEVSYLPNSKYIVQFKLKN